MIRIGLCGILAAGLLLTPLLAFPQNAPYLHAPAVAEYALHNPNGTTILPDGRLLKPVGRHFPLAKWPHGMILSPDGKTLFVVSAGVGQLITDWETEHPTIVPVSPSGGGGRRGKNSGGGAAFSSDGATLYWSSGDSGGLMVFDVAKKEKIADISLNGDLNGRAYADSYAMDVKVSGDGQSVYCADVTNFRVAVISAVQKKVVGSVDVGRYPYALAVSGHSVYVANIGMFEYSAIPAPMESGFDKLGLTFPPFGFPTKEARDGVHFEGRDIPGLGDPNDARSFSVWGIDASDPANPKVVNRIKTGLKVGAVSNGIETVGGSAPNYLLPVGDTLYVCNNNNDSIDALSLSNGAIKGHVQIVPSQLVAKVRGLSLAGMAASPDGTRLYAAESGLNAIVVLDTRSNKVVGQIPTPWYPYRLAMSADGRKLACISFRGFGNGPNAGKNIPNSPFLGMKGALSVMDVPTEAELPGLTQTVLDCTGLIDRSADRASLSSPLIPTIPGKVSEQIKYVVFITKENHTYDTIFDRIPGANDDPALLRWGADQTITGPGQPALEHTAVMTNHNALARQFTVSDNFYMEPEASGVGHRWLVGVQPNNFCQMLYTLGWNFQAKSAAPGRRAPFGSNGSIAPEDYPEAGSMWEHLARHGKTFRNYGEGFEFAGVGEDDNEGVTGAREVINMPMSKVLYDNTCRTFPIFNMNIPDVYRAEWFIQDFTTLFLPQSKTARAPDFRKGVTPVVQSGRGKPAQPSNHETRDTKHDMPSFINICICNDHGSETKPAKGYPYRASWMADNDLALGRIVEFLSHTPYWRNMAIFVTQDDAGGEPDHVDAQRSVLLVISPWVKRGAVSHCHTTILSMHRTLYQILGLPPLNLQDAIANDFSDCFTTTPDFRPYNAVPVDKRVFDEARARDASDPEFRKARRAASIRRDDPDEVERQAAGND